MQVGAVAGEGRDRLGLEAHPHPMAFRQGGRHHAEEGVAVGGQQRFGVGPVQFELAIGVLVIGLVRPPAEALHAVQQFADQRVVAHQGQLVVAGLGLPVEAIGDGVPFRVHQEELRLDAAAELQAHGRRPGDLTLEHPARRLLQHLALHLQIGGHPGHVRLPGEHHQAGDIGDRQHVRIGRGHVEPGGETGEAGPGSGQFGRRGRRHQLGPLHPEQVAEGEEEVADAMGGGEAGQIGHRGW